MGSGVAVFGWRQTGVAIYDAGTNAAMPGAPLVLGFRSALRALGMRGSVIVTDVNPLSPAVYSADRAYAVPMASERVLLLPSSSTSRLSSDLPR